MRLVEISKGRRRVRRYRGPAFEVVLREGPKMTQPWRIGLQRARASLVRIAALAILTVGCCAAARQTGDRPQRPKHQRTRSGPPDSKSDLRVFDGSLQLGQLGSAEQKTPRASTPVERQLRAGGSSPSGVGGMSLSRRMACFLAPLDPVPKYRV
jgi:hypothetical protein